MANRFGSDILIQARDPRKAALFYVEHLGFEITDDNPNMIGLHGKHINLFIEPGPALGPVLEVTVDSVEKAKARLLKNGCAARQGQAGRPEMLRERSVQPDLQPYELTRPHAQTPTSALRAF